MTVARTYQLAAEAVSVRSPAGRVYQAAVEVISRTGAGATPLTGSPAVIQTLGVESVQVKTTANTRSYQIAAEVISRSGLGADPPQTTRATVQTYAAEVVAAPLPKSRIYQAVAEVVSRSGQGINPLLNNPAEIQGYAVEVLSRSVPPSARRALLYGMQVEIITAPQDAGCDCVITNQPAPARHVMRRRRTA